MVLPNTKASSIHGERSFQWGRKREPKKAPKRRHENRQGNKSNGVTAKQKEVRRKQSHRSKPEMTKQEEQSKVSHSKKRSNKLASQSKNKQSKPTNQKKNRNNSNTASQKQKLNYRRDTDSNIKYQTAQREKEKSTSTIAKKSTRRKAK